MAVIGLAAHTGGLAASLPPGHTRRATRKHTGLTQPQLAMAAGGVRFGVELASGKPTVQLQSVLWVTDALGGIIRLDGLPGAASEGTSHGA